MIYCAPENRRANIGNHLPLKDFQFKKLKISLDGRAYNSRQSVGLNTTLLEQTVEEFTSMEGLIIHLQVGQGA